MNEHEQGAEVRAEQTVVSRLFTSKIEHPGKRSVRAYLQLLRRILAHPKVQSVSIDTTKPIEVSYYSHALDQTLGEKLAYDIPGAEVLARVRIEPVHLPLYEGVVHIFMAAEAVGLAPCCVYVKSVALLHRLGWTQRSTFMQARVEELEQLPRDLILFGLAPDSACTNADVQRLWSLQVEEETKRTVSASDALPPSS